MEIDAGLNSGLDNDLNTDKAVLQLVELLLKEKAESKRYDREEKIKKVLMLLAGGAALATVIAAPGTALLFKDFVKDDSSWKEWQKFNRTYLRRTIRRLEKEKIVEIEEKDGLGKVKITDKGRKKILQFGLESVSIAKPTRWDGKWRLVLYDIFSHKKSTRDRLQKYLKAGNFYPLQESVYLHAYPCEKEIEFLRYYLGVEGEVRLIIADSIENDSQFRAYFGV